MACRTGAQRSTRTFLGAPPTPRFGVGEARMQTPGAEMRRGNEEVCVLEIERPGMEDSESAKKQENTGIGPASACRGESAFTRVFHALWMEVVASSSCAGLTRASI